MEQSPRPPTETPFSSSPTSDHDHDGNNDPTPTKKRKYSSAKAPNKNEETAAESATIEEATIVNSSQRSRSPHCNLKTKAHALCDELLMSSEDPSWNLRNSQLSSTNNNNNNNNTQRNQNNEAAASAEMRQLLALDEAWRSMMNDRIRAKAQEVNALRRQQHGSFLSSLTTELLECIARYLWEPDLGALEELSSAVIPKEALIHQWNRLDQRPIRRLLQSKRTFSTPRERGIDFATVSRYASTLEHSARLHYHSDNHHIKNTDAVDYDWPEECYTCADFYRDFWRMDSTGTTHSGAAGETPTSSSSGSGREFFLRLSYQENNDHSSSSSRNPNNDPVVLLEGFQHEFGMGWRHDTNRFAQFCLNNPDESFMTFEFVGLMDELLGQQRMGLLQHQRQQPNAPANREDLLGRRLRWSASDRKRFLDNLFVTILACDCGCDDSTPSASGGGSLMRPEPQLVVATNGYFSAKYRREVVYAALTPRNPNAKEKVACPDYGVNVGILIRERDMDSFAILVEWGDPDQV